MGVKEQFISRAFSGGSGLVGDPSRREFLSAAAALLVGLGLPSTCLAGGGQHGAGGSGQRVVLVIFGGVRRAETFSPEGIENIPHLSSDLLQRALLFTDIRNEGVTRIMHVSEDKGSLICYKHVVETVFEAAN